MAVGVSKRAIKHILFLVKKGKFREIYNYAWVKTLWWSPFWQKVLISRLGRWYDIYPPFLEIEPTTVCNLKCIMCEHTYWNEPPKNISFDEFRGIVDQFPHLKWMGLTGIGSSFLNKDFLKMVRYLKSKSVIVELIDTFNHIDGQIVEELVGMGVNIYFISMSGATKETYEKVCVGANFDKVMENLKYLVRLKKERKTELPILNFHYIISRTNMHEMITFVELIHSLDCDAYEVLFTPLLHAFDEVKDEAVEISDEAIQAVGQRAKELGVRLAYSPTVPKNKPPISDCVQWLMPFIFSTGHVIVCCTGNEANRRDFQKETSMGNVFEQGFKEIWYGDNYRKFREMIRKGEVPIQCVGCNCFNTTGKSKKGKTKEAVS